MGRQDGNGFVKCVHGHRHWGLHGAAGLLLSDPERGILLQRRAWWVHHGRTWALPGGAVEAGETPLDAAVREAGEEAAVPADAVRAVAASQVDHGNWQYTTVLATVTGPIRERVSNAESAELRWVPPDDVADYRLHPDFATAWPGLRPQLGRELVLVVDGANVVGSRPDGWWRDRLGAAARLRDKLAALSLTTTALTGAGGPGWTWWPRILLVVEGQARGLESVPGAEVVTAPADGDSAIVATTEAALTARPADHVVVVTADRELRTRVEPLGATTLGPSTLLTALDALLPKVR